MSRWRFPMSCFVLYQCKFYVLNPSCTVGMKILYDCILGLHVVLISLDWESGNCWPRKLRNSKSDWKLVDRRIPPSSCICLDSFLLDGHPLILLVNTCRQIPYHKYPSPKSLTSCDVLQSVLGYRENRVETILTLILDFVNPCWQILR
jgi:hypothetical protein